MGFTPLPSLFYLGCGDILTVLIMANDPSSSTRSSLSLAAVILGAGRSRRMGTPKLLLPWGGDSILGHLIQQWRTLAAAQVTVVVSSEGVEIAHELDRLAF